MKKKIVIIYSVIIVILGLVIGLCSYSNYNKKKEEQENYNRIVNETNSLLENFKNNKLSDGNSKVSQFLNAIIEEEDKNNKINFNEYRNRMVTNDILDTNIEELINNINKEIDLYNELDIDRFNVDKLLTIIAENDVEVEENILTNEYNNQDFIKNLDSEKSKRNDYIENLKVLKKDLTVLKNNRSKLTKTNETYFGTNDEVLKEVKGIINKYNLTLKVEKKVYENKPILDNQTDVVTYKGVPILCYHGVLDVPWGIANLFVRVDEFENQMKYLSENGYTPIFASEISNAQNVEKPVIITFDDGYKDVYTNAFPILQKYNLKANVYMISGWINGDVYMTSDMTKEMANSPLIEIGSHTVNHKSLQTLSNEEIEYELKESKRGLEELIGKEVNVIAYPKGGYDSRVINIASNYYKYALSTNKGKENPNKLNTYTLKRLYVYRGTSVEGFKNILG